jgi:hypothetical protein
MRTLRLATSLAVLAAALSCAGKPSLQFASDPNARFDGLKTFAWYVDPSFQIPRGGSTVDGQFIDRRIREAADKDMTKKGFQKSADGKADLYLAYHVDQVGVASQDKFGGYDWWSGYIYVGAKYQKEGSLTLDVLAREQDRDHRAQPRGRGPGHRRRRRRSAGEVPAD